ncbi:uncharacterized protein Z518_03772 [Rhinocladiella mackenziei CBS 650.93]|uniref:Uncharacterized protein n=1 Tax=Rhinocladiella mackenziei CBS 650.93 TaxID=1442369 RepID=A0A0D2J9K8_9EURO|nr:uncharacterized protein Z518_03772 [Rhinocladiella mackenziei CBS 650.93]KIX05800.1 hypothetical protein Z518_03772 [Rhinocladiella mackenziei CBS 650.93]
MDLTLLPIVLLSTPDSASISPLHTFAALHGRPKYLSFLLLCLGMQTPLSPSALCNAEYPACAAMTTGYIFRVENQAVVMLLQRIGRTGHLVTLKVEPESSPSTTGTGAGSKSARGVLGLGSALEILTFLPPLFLLHWLVLHPSDVYLLLSTLLLLTSRLLFILSLRVRTQPSWHGVFEPGAKGDLLVLMSEDRWIRMQGLVDDLKAVTSGSWLVRSRNHFLVDGAEWVSRFLVYIATIALVNARDEGKILLTLCVTINHVLLLMHNSRVEEMSMNGRRIRVQEGGVKKYKRRLDMAEELVEEVGRSDFAVRLGLVNPNNNSSASAEAKESGIKRQGKEKGNDPDNEVVTM